MQGDSGEVVRKQSPACGIDLNELHNSESAGGLQAASVAADVAEKVEDIHARLARAGARGRPRRARQNVPRAGVKLLRCPAAKTAEKPRIESLNMRFSTIRWGC